MLHNGRLNEVNKKFVQQGEKVGYDEMGVVAEDGYIYTIGLGYADGWPRNYRTSAYFIINFGNENLEQKFNNSYCYKMRNLFKQKHNNKNRFLF